MEFEGIFENKIPLDAFPAKIQDMILALSRQENYSIEYMMASLLVAVSTAIGNAVNIRIRGGWISNPALYMILVGRPGMGKPHLWILHSVLSESMMPKSSNNLNWIWSIIIAWLKTIRLKKTSPLHCRTNQFYEEPSYPILHRKL